MNPLDFPKAYRVDSLSLGDKVGLFSGSQNPNTIDTSGIPVGSLYCQTDGNIWKRKTMNGDGWEFLLSSPTLSLSFVLADSTIIRMPLTNAGEVALMLANGDTGSLSLVVGD
ncbi:MAG: hypothetical protein HQM06_18065 [Magnetococcales bacterium]|nr:hypothetical protein [Magnetococcales bacterium]